MARNDVSHGTIRDTVPGTVLEGSGRFSKVLEGSGGFSAQQTEFRPASGFPAGRIGRIGRTLDGGSQLNLRGSTLKTSVGTPHAKFQRGEPEKQLLDGKWAQTPTNLLSLSYLIPIFQLTNSDSVSPPPSVYTLGGGLTEEGGSLLRWPRLWRRFQAAVHCRSHRHAVWRDPWARDAASRHHGLDFPAESAGRGANALQILARGRASDVQI